MDLLSTLGANLGSGLTILLAFLFALTVVVFVHEFGHFQVARWCGVAVKTFSIGFGRELFGWNDRHGTHWRIAAIPLGGYVQFVDDANPASAGADADGDDAGTQDQELTEEQRAGAFHSKPVWKRAAVVAAGPIYNFILAIVIFAVTFMVLGYSVTKPEVAQVTPDSPASKAGFKRGDVITGIDGDSIEAFKDLQKIISRRIGQELTFTVTRDGGDVTLKATPELRQVDDNLNGKSCRPVIGILFSPRARVGSVLPDSPAADAGFIAGDEIIAINGKKVEYHLEVAKVIKQQVGQGIDFTINRDGATLTLTATPAIREITDPSGRKISLPFIGVLPQSSPVKYFGPIEAVARGAQETLDIVTGTLSYLGDVFTGNQPANQIGGIVRIADIAGKVATIDWRRLIVFAAFISVSIGLINLFPVPVLDGGHLVFFAIEAIRGKPLSEKVQEYFFRVGLALILMLMIFGFWNDRGILLRWLLGPTDQIAAPLCGG